MKLLEHQPLQMWEGSCGALMCSGQIEGVTQELPRNSRCDYNGVYFIAESMCESAQRKVAAAFGAKYLDGYAEAPNTQRLTLSTFQIKARYGCYKFGDAVLIRHDVLHIARETVLLQVPFKGATFTDTF